MSKKQSKRHYHVIENTPGYLPDSDDNTAFTNKRDAGRCAKELTDQYRDDPDGDYTITGNMHSGYEIADNSKMYDLGRVIEIVECYEAECVGDSNND